MSKTVIPLTSDRRDEALDLLDRCFEQTPRMWFEIHQKADPNWDISQQLVIEDDQEIIGHIWIANRKMRYGSGLIPIGGIADVAVHRDHRNRGNSGKLLDAAINLMDKSQQPLSLLGTSFPEVYTGKGWHPIPTSRLVAEFPSGDIEWAGGQVVRPFTPEDLPDIQAAYNELSADRVGPIKRSDEYWLAMTSWLPNGRLGLEINFDVLTHVNTVVGYSITGLNNDSLYILDSGIEYEDLALPLLNTWRSRAQKRGASKITGELHPNSEIFNLLRKRASARLEETKHYMVRLNSLEGTLVAAAPELIRRRRRSAPLPGPTFVLEVDDQAARVETPMADVIIGEPRGDEPVVNMTSTQFLNLFLGVDSGHKGLKEIGAPSHIEVYLQRLFPDSPFSFWLADQF
jgi:predicted acetyltransferase